MLRWFLRGVLPYSLAFFLAIPVATLGARQKSQSLTFESVNDSHWEAQVKPSASLLVKLQVLLDRAHASPGVIDGKLGENTRRAIAAFSEMKGLERTEQANEPLWRISSKAIQKQLSSPTRSVKRIRRGPSPRASPTTSEERRRWSGLAIQALRSFWLRNST